MSETGTTYGTGKLAALGAGISRVRLARCRGGLRLTFRRGAERHTLKVPMGREDALRVFAAGKDGFGVMAQIACAKGELVEHTVETRWTVRFRVPDIPDAVRMFAPGADA